MYYAALLYIHEHKQHTFACISLALCAHRDKHGKNINGAGRRSSQHTELRPRTWRSVCCAERVLKRPRKPQRDWPQLARCSSSPLFLIFSLQGGIFFAGWGRACAHNPWHVIFLQSLCANDRCQPIFPKVLSRTDTGVIITHDVK